MPQIKLEKPWTYRTPLKTIDYPAGEHDVFQYVADKAEEDGAITASGTPDPLDGSIPDVTAHIASIDDPAEIDRLIRNERGGKTRSGAMKVLEARRDELAG